MSADATTAPGLARMHPAYFCARDGDGDRVDRVPPARSPLDRRRPYALNVVLRGVVDRDRPSSRSAPRPSCARTLPSWPLRRVLHDRRSDVRGRSQSIVAAGRYDIALGLWFFAIVLWASDVPDRHRPHANGSTSRRSRRGSTEVGSSPWSRPTRPPSRRPDRPHLADHAPHALFFCLQMWLGGSMLYLWIISPIFYRYTFFTLEPERPRPPYWINMGAAAIRHARRYDAHRRDRALAGAPAILPFVRASRCLGRRRRGGSALVIFGIWRHIYKKFPLRYDPLYWGAVFRSGCTPPARSGSRKRSTLRSFAIPRVSVFVAIAAWCPHVRRDARALRTRATGTARAHGCRLRFMTLRMRAMDRSFVVGSDRHAAAGPPRSAARLQRSSEHQAPGPASSGKLDVAGASPTRPLESSIVTTECRGRGARRGRRPRRRALGTARPRCDARARASAACVATMRQARERDEPDDAKLGSQDSAERGAQSCVVASAGKSPRPWRSRTPVTRRMLSTRQPTVAKRAPTPRRSNVGLRRAERRRDGDHHECEDAHPADPQHRGEDMHDDGDEIDRAHDRSAGLPSTRGARMTGR